MPSSAVAENTRANLRLYSYWRSSAAYRVRIGLHLKALPFEIVPVHLLADGGQQHSAAYVQINPQHLVPSLQHGQVVLHQSLAILEYLDECFPTPALLPSAPLLRQQVRAFAQLVACDIHPINNLRILRYLQNTLDVEQAQRDAWVQHWIIEGFNAAETLLQQHAQGKFCFGDTPTLADCSLIPQVYNARRFGVALDAFPRIVAIEKACLALPAFEAAAPEAQPDAVLPTAS